MTKENTYMWIYWLVEERGLKATTIGNYLSGVRQLHVARGPRAEGQLGQGHTQRQKQDGGIKEQGRRNRKGKTTYDDTPDETAEGEDWTI